MPADTKKDLNRVESPSLSLSLVPFFLSIILCSFHFFFAQSSSSSSVPGEKVFDRSLIDYSVLGFADLDSRLTSFVAPLNGSTLTWTLKLCLNSLNSGNHYNLLWGLLASMITEFTENVAYCLTMRIEFIAKMVFCCYPYEAHLLLPTRM